MGEADEKTARPFFIVCKEGDAIEENGNGRGNFRTFEKRRIFRAGRSPLFGAFDAFRHGDGAGADPSGAAREADGGAAPKAADFGPGRLPDMASREKA